MQGALSLRVLAGCGRDLECQLLRLWSPWRYLTFTRTANFFRLLVRFRISIRDKPLHDFSNSNE